MSNKGFDLFVRRRTGLTRMLLAGPFLMGLCLFAQADQPCRAGDLTDAGDLSIPVQKVKVSPPTPASSVPSASTLFDNVSGLLHEYYPRGLKLSTKPNIYHAEYRVRMEHVVQTNTVEPFPELGGIWITMELKPGPYRGTEGVPKILNQYDGPYKVMILAPDSKKADCHLSVRIAYPNDVNPDFLTRFKNTVADFDKYITP